MNKQLAVVGFSFLLSLGLKAQVLTQPGLPKTVDTLQLGKEKATRFIAMGDWGRNGDDHQIQVAEQMTKTAKAAKIDFVVSTGDNFYPSGVISEQDPLFRSCYEDIYKSFVLQCDWYVVLGNHDYKSNPDAQVKYSSISRRWKMPARYFSKKIAIGGDTSQQVLIAFIDTNPLIPEFYSNSEYGPNVKGQDTTAQKAWLENLLADSSANIKWKIVVGHHPMYTGGSRTDGYDTKRIRTTLQPILDKYGVDVYLTGHEHSLQHLKAAGKTQHFISGAASESTATKLIPESQMVASAYGFMLFELSGKKLTVQTIDDKGKVIYRTSIAK